MLENYVPVYVMLQATVITRDNKLPNPGELETQLQKLRDADVDGVMVDVWWGIVEAKVPGLYDWSSYTALFKLIRKVGLKIQAVMSFHQCGSNEGDRMSEDYIPLPEWVYDVGEKNSDIFYKDQAAAEEGGNQNWEYLTIGVDNEKIFPGDRDAVKIYSNFMRSFREDMAEFLESWTIVAIVVGLGPSGQLRYPSYQKTKQWRFPGIGEFQCYDKYLREDFKKEASNKSNNGEWNIPVNLVKYNDKPGETPTFASRLDNKRKFFFKWYSKKLLMHGDKILEEANKVFCGYRVKLAAKVSGIHWWYLDGSHAAELTAGYYNLNDRDGYRPIAKMLSRHHATLHFSCLEMKNSEDKFSEANCGPEQLVQRVLSAGWVEGIEVIGENALERYDEDAYNQIIRNARPQGRSKDGPLKYKISGFTYNRLSNELIDNGSNFNLFKEFIRKMHADQDLFENYVKLPRLRKSKPRCPVNKLVKEAKQVLPPVTWYDVKEKLQGNNVPVQESSVPQFRFPLLFFLFLPLFFIFFFFSKFAPSLLENI